jgi:hypothetical protein
MRSLQILRLWLSKEEGCICGEAADDDKVATRSAGRADATARIWREGFFRVARQNVLLT